MKHLISVLVLTLVLSACAKQNDPSGSTQNTATSSTVGTAPTSCPNFTGNYASESYYLKISQQACESVTVEYVSLTNRTQVSSQIYNLQQQVKSEVTADGSLVVRTSTQFTDGALVFSSVTESLDYDVEASLRVTQILRKSWGGGINSSIHITDGQRRLVKAYSKELRPI